MDLKRWKLQFGGNTDVLSNAFLVLCALFGLVLLFLAGPCTPTTRPPAPSSLPTAAGGSAGASLATLTPSPTPQASGSGAPSGRALTPTPGAPVPSPGIRGPEPNTPIPTPTPPGGGFRSIAFSSNRADGRYHQLYLMDADGNDLQRLTHTQAFDRDPHFAYDRQRIAFSSNREDGCYQIYLLDLSTRAVKKLTSGPEDKTNPVWSPDNRRLIVTMQKNDRTQLVIMNDDGTGMQQITDTYGENHAYSFSSDNTLIAYESGLNRRSEIFTYDLTGRNISLLIRSDDLTQCGNPVFNPAGRTLLFTSDLAQRRLGQIFVLTLTTGEYLRITHDNVAHDDPVYSPDGTLIAYVALWEGAWNVFRMKADGTEVVNLTKSYYDNYSPTWR
jgi:TolB protein